MKEKYYNLKKAPLRRRNIYMVLITLTAFLLALTECKKEGQSPTGKESGTGAPSTAGLKDSFEPTRLKIVEIIKSDIKDRKTPLRPDEYQKLAERILNVPGLEGAEYVGDDLGTIFMKVKDGGFMVWRHIKNDFNEGEALPEDADLNNFLNPKWNKGWKAERFGRADEGRFEKYAIDERPQIKTIQFLIPKGPMSSGIGNLPRPAGKTNTYATHFPVATGRPDPDFNADDAVSCPDEGKIAIIDFVWTGAHKDYPGLYDSQYIVDGVPFYDRIKMMGEAAGFHVDLFKDSEINLGNFKKLEDYTIVILIGHGARPGDKATERLGIKLTGWLTPEIYEPNKVTDGGVKYEDAWKRGYILRHADNNAIFWTPLLFKDLYKPRTDQLWMPNQCYTMLPINTGYYKEGDKWVWKNGVTGFVYNFGDALMETGVKVVFGYILRATPETIVKNTMTFFRRLLGGYYIKDAPPAPHIFWPTCMSAQTYFRVPGTPRLPIYGNKYSGKSVYTMYAVDESKFFRKVCSHRANSHAYLQSFMLRVGTPATGITNCWERYWGKGEKVTGLKDPLCGQGDFPTNEQATHDAACAVKIARKVTNAMLKDTP